MEMDEKTSNEIFTFPREYKALTRKKDNST